MEKRTVEIKIGKHLSLTGDLNLPSNTRELVIFVHGSGSSRFSTRNQYVAEIINQAKIGTLLFDLLTEEEEVIDVRTAEYRFNIPMLAQRLVEVTNWVVKQPEFAHFKLGYFGASTGAAAALIAVIEHANKVKAVVSRGGRPDLASEILGQIRTPTLLIVGGFDNVVIELNEQAKDRMIHAHTELVLVPNATHLFEEPGALEEVAGLATKWFAKYLKE